jgi:hypothetical protein
MQLDMIASVIVFAHVNSLIELSTNGFKVGYLSKSSASSMVF